MVSEVSPFRQYQELNHAQPQQVQYLPPQCCSCKRHKMMSDDIIVISLYFLDKNKVQTSVSTPILQSSQHKGRLLYHHKGQASPIHQKVQDSSQAVDGSKINQCQSFSNFLIVKKEFSNAAVSYIQINNITIMQQLSMTTSSQVISGYFSATSRQH